MHHSIWIEHDGSWTWSIEEGKAFEDDHKVLARDDGFPTRGDAKEDMQKAWARLIDQGKKPGRIGEAPPATAPAAAPKTSQIKKPAANTKTATVNGAFSPTLPEWAVIVDGKIVALFAEQAVAKKYAGSVHADGHQVQRITLGALPV